MNAAQSNLPSTGKWRRWLLAAGLVALLAAALRVAYLPSPLVIEVATVTQGRFEQVIEEDGRLRLQQRYTVTAPMAAQLQRPTLKVGDSVAKGDVVVTLTPLAASMIDTRTRSVLQERLGGAQAALSAAEANVLRLQAALAQANLEAERAESLARSQFVSSAYRDQASLARESAAQALRAGQAQRDAAEHASGEARAALQSAQVDGAGASSATLALRSPVSGRVLKLHKESAETVSPGQPLMEMGDTSQLEAVVEVLSAESTRIPLGAAVQWVAGRGQPGRAGTVTRIEPQAFTKLSALGIEEQRVNVIVSLQPSDIASLRLGDGFRVEARITVSSHEPALLIPSGALVREADDRWNVFVVSDQKATRRSITIKDRNADLVWVGEGLKVGEAVILYPGNDLREGQRVRLRGDAAQ